MKPELETLEKLASAELPASPCYIFDRDILINKVRQIRSALPACNALCFAIKANPFLVSLLKDELDRFEACSPGEYEICYEQGVNPDKIIISGVNKTEASMRRILSLSGGRGIYTVESPLHYEILSSLAEEMNLQLSLMIRLSSGNQFGVDRESFHQILQKLLKDSHCSLRGVHFFSGTQKKLRRIEKELAAVNEFGAELKERCGLDSLELEYGPGLAVGYFEDDNTASSQEQLEALQGLLAGMDSFSRIGIELGRFMAADCGYFVTQVMDIKKTENSHYAILDGGFHQLSYYGQMMGMKKPPLRQVPLRSEEDRKHYVLCGSLCSINDIILRDAELALQLGDKLIFALCGAYSMTEAPALFLSRELPAVYLRNSQGEFRCLREQSETYILNSMHK